MSADNPQLRVSRTVERKRDLKKDLINRDLKSIEKKTISQRNTLRSLSSLLFDDDPLIRWRAIEALGKVSAVMMKGDPEKIRRQIRRILWLMNDESGGLCWNGPEAIAEILYNVTSLINEYGPMLIPFLTEEPFEAGTRRAIARVAEKDRAIFAKSVEILEDSLKNPNPEIRAFSVKALIAVKNTSAREMVEELQSDNSLIVDYDFSTGELKEGTVGEFARSYLNHLENRD